MTPVKTLPSRVSLPAETTLPKREPEIRAPKPTTLVSPRDRRAAHKATRESVGAEGHISAQLLYSAFDSFNRHHFGARLATPMILIMPSSTPRTLGDYIKKDVHGLESRIRIAPKVVRTVLASEADQPLSVQYRFAVDVLLHEMIHAWQVEVVHDEENGYRGHGPKFAAACNAIGSKLGLGEVGVKGRDGKPDCAYWPMNVRAANYYPVVFQVPTRGPNQPKTPRAPRQRGGQPNENTVNWSTIGELCALVCKLSDDDLGMLGSAIVNEMKRRQPPKKANAS